MKMNANTDIYDNFLSKIDELRWLPWIGTNYNKATNKLLLVGESHYAQNKDGSVDQNCYNDFLNDKQTTRVIINSLVNKENNWNLFKNTYTAILGKNEIDTKSFWSNVSFYNFIQRPMNTRKLDGPSKKDYIDGWNVFFELLKTIKPTHCIFLGNSGANYLNTPLSEKKIEISEINLSDEKIGRCWGKFAQIIYDDFPVKLTFIRHPSSYFSPNKWREYLMKRNSSLLNELIELQSK